VENAAPVSRLVNNFLKWGASAISRTCHRVIRRITNVDISTEPSGSKKWLEEICRIEPRKTNSNKHFVPKISTGFTVVRLKAQICLSTSKIIKDVFIGFAMSVGLSACQPVRLVYVKLRISEVD
jgi:hypothetical protein